MTEHLPHMQPRTGPCGAGRGPDKAVFNALNGIKFKLAVMSGKGGVGKSSITANLAASLAAMNFKVGILDIDLHGPSIPTMFNLHDPIEIDPLNSLMLPARYNENISMISMDNLLRGSDTPVIWRGPKKTAAIHQFLSEVSWGTLDFLLIDSPPGSGDEHLTVIKEIYDLQCIVVTTPQEISLADVRKTINFLLSAKIPILGIIENMSGLVCPYCHREFNPFKKGGGADLAKKFSVDLLGTIPLDPAMMTAADKGIPVVSLTEDSPSKSAFIAITRNMTKNILTHKS